MSSGSAECPDQEKFADTNREAEGLIISGNFSEAAAILGRIVEQDPTNWRAYNNFGVICWEQKKWNDAFVMFKKSVAMRLDYADALANLFDAAL